MVLPLRWCDPVSAVVPTRASRPSALAEHGGAADAPVAVRHTSDDQCRGAGVSGRSGEMGCEPHARVGEREEDEKGDDGSRAGEDERIAGTAAQAPAPWSRDRLVSSVGVMPRPPRPGSVPQSSPRWRPMDNPVERGRNAQPRPGDAGLTDS